MSKGSQTTSTQTSTAPPGYVNQAYQGLISNTNQLAQTPYTPFGGEGVAPINPQQYQGIADINQYALSGIPLYQQAAGLIGGAAQPLNPTQIQQYYSPYQQDVINTTQKQFDLMNRTALNNIQGNAAAQGALGGDRPGVAQAAYYQGVLPGQEQTIAGLENTGYANALATAAQQFQQNPLATAFGLGNVASGETNTALQGASAVTGAGTLEQGTSQALDQYLYNQYLAQMGYPFALNQYAAGIDTGVGSVAGGTSQGTTTGPPPSFLGQLLGLGTAGAGAYGAYQGAQPRQATGGRIKGYALGGSPVMPYGGAPSYIPSPGGLAHGPGPPQARAPSAPGQQGGASSMFGEAQQLAGMGKMGQGVGSGLASLGSGAGAVTPEAWTAAGLDLGTIGPGVADLGAGAAADLGIGAAADAGAAGAADLLPLLLLAKKGGRIQLPMRSGMGMPSFVRGYQYGGSPFDTASFESADAEAMRQHALDVQSYNLSPTSDVTQTFSSPRPEDWAPPGDTPQMRAAVGAPASDEEIIPPGSRALAFNGDAGGVGGGYQPPPRLPPSARPQITAGQGGQGFMGMSPEFWQSLMAAGLGTAAAAGRPGASPLGAIGEGGIFGLKTYGGLKGKEADIEMESRKLDQQAQAESDRIAMEGRRLTEMTPYQKQEVDLRRQQIQQDLWQPFTDISGMTRFFNKKTGEIKDTPPIKVPGTAPAAPGTPTSDAGTPQGGVEKPTQVASTDPQITAQASNGVSADSYDAKPASIKAPTHPELQNRNEEFLKTLDPYTQNLLKGVADYKINPAQLSFRDKTNVNRFIATYDPDWSQIRYNTIAKAMPNFTGSGVEARNMTSQDMAMQHIGSALDNIRKLDQGNVVSWNKLRNVVKGQYDPETQAVLGGLGTDVQAIQNELTTSFRGSGHPSEREALQWAQKIDYNNPAGLRGALQEAASLLGGRIAAAGHRYNDAVGDTYARDPLSWMSTKGTASYNRALNLDPVKGEGSAKPTLKNFLDKARTANPNASEQELTDFYNKKYGG